MSPPRPLDAPQHNALDIPVKMYMLYRYAISQKQKVH